MSTLDASKSISLSVALLLCLALLAPGFAAAAVAFDAATESHTGTSGSASEASFTFSHNPSGTARGILVFVLTASSTKAVTGVTYDGEVMTEVSGGAAADTSTETGRVDTFFLGTGVNTTDPADVVVSRTNDVKVMYAVAISVTASIDTTQTGIVLLENNGAIAEQSVNDGSPGTNSVRFAMGYTGSSTPPIAGANSTFLHSIDLGSFGATTVRETTAGQGARSVGMIGLTDDRAVVHLAVTEYLAAPTVTTNFATPGANTATLNGTKTAGTDTVQYGFAYGTNATLTSGVATSALGVLSADSSFTNFISGLSENSTYFFRAYATNTAGSAYGVIKSFVTGVSTPTRTMMLFQGSKIKLVSGKLILRQAFAYAAPPAGLDCDAGSNITFTDIGGGQCRGYITNTATSSWIMPTNWNDTDNKIEVIGGGGGGGLNYNSGAAGGNYCYLDDFATTTTTTIINNSASLGGPGATVVWGGKNGRTTYFAGGTLLKAGGGGGTSNAGSPYYGEPSTDNAGTCNSGAHGGTANGEGGAGGGGAGGPNGVGAVGGDSIADADGGAGGGGNGGGTAGANSTGTNGANGGNNSSAAGSGAGGCVKKT